MEWSNFILACRIVPQLYNFLETIPCLLSVQTTNMSGTLEFKHVQAKARRDSVAV